MTAPNQPRPAGAYSAGSGAQTPRHLRLVSKSALQTSMQTQLVTLYAAFPANLANMVRIGMLEFAASFCEAVTGFTGGLIDLRGWATQLRSRAQDARADAGTARAAAELAERIVADSADAVRAGGSRIQVVLDGLPIKPYWETMNLTEESSLPRSLLSQRVWDVSYTDKPGYTAYSYLYIAYYSQNLPVYVARPFYVQYAPSYIPPANTLEGAYIRCRYSGGRKIVTYIPDGVSGTPCTLHVVVGRVLDGGDIRIEWVSDDQTPHITTSRFEQSVEIPDEIVFEAGETAFVGIHQRGAGSVRPLLGTTITDLPRPATAWPPRPTVRFTSSATLTAGGVLASGDLGYSSNSVPYVALSKKLGDTAPPGLRFYEDFQTGLPTVFARMSSLAAAVSGGVFVVSGGTDGPRRYIYAQRLNYDDQMVTGRIIDPTVRHAWLVLRSSPANRTFVSLNVTQSGVLLYQYAAGTWTPLTSVTTMVSSGDVLRLQAVGPVYTAQRRTAGVWTDLFTYTDSANTLPIGPGHRYTGLGNERVSFVNGGGWDYWKAEDLL